MTYDPYTPEEIRDLISDAISDSMDMDWQPGWGADAVVKALADAGLMVVPDLEKVCAEHDFTHAAIRLHVRGDRKWWGVGLHRDAVVFSNASGVDRDPHSGLASALASEGFDTAEAKAAADRPVAA